MIYTQCGLRLRSEVELHLPAHRGGGWDVDITWGDDIDDSSEPPPGDVIAIFEADETAWYTGTWTGSRYLLRFRNCGEFVISADLSEVQVRRDPAGRSDLLPILIAGTLSAFLLTLRGGSVLHASAVSIQGTALAFVGQSGRGKSTVAAVMCTAGADLVTDDVLVVDAGPPVTCIGGASELRLRPGAATIADDRPDVATRTTADERLAFAPPTAALKPLPLAGIVIPAPSRTATDVVIERLPPSEALVGLLSFPRVHGWRRPDVLSREFATYSQLVNTIPVYTVTIPWGPPFSPDVPRSLSALITDAPDPASG